MKNKVGHLTVTATIPRYDKEYFKDRSYDVTVRTMPINNNDVTVRTMPINNNDFTVCTAPINNKPSVVSSLHYVDSNIFFPITFTVNDNHKEVASFGFGDEP